MSVATMQVKNLDDCISINHNWVNSCNLGAATSQVVDDHGDVVKSIQDSCGKSEDFPVVCEGLLKAHAGINLGGFFSFLSHGTCAEASIATAASAGERDGEILASAFRCLISA